MGWNFHKRDVTHAQRGLSLAALVLVGSCAAHAAAAAPLVRQQPLRPQPQLQAQQQRSAPQSPAVPQHLDLRAPSNMADFAESPSDRSFPSRRQTEGSQESLQLPALGVNGVARPTLQQFARRVHQEGLPVARLYEGKFALVHLGLNPKGKPGLWLVQKIR